MKRLTDTYRVVDAVLGSFVPPLKLSISFCDFNKDKKIDNICSGCGLHSQAPSSPTADIFCGGKSCLDSKASEIHLTNILKSLTPSHQTQIHQMNQDHCLEQVAENESTPFHL